ncbi:response regulator [Brevundimonas sp.]|uniref:response regulator n=1 Tax=Brevundimonas sp. TaxID=1871086 RepID=UPI0026365637|nr:response regulator [Brevundimonas sp.]
MTVTHDIGGERPPHPAAGRGEGGAPEVDNALILIVEDEAEIAEILDAYLVRAGFRTVRAADGEAALLHHRMLRPDLVLLDVRLPRRDGHAVLAEIRAVSDVPVIMATALGEDLEKLMALRVGADDYVVKPFNPLEVVARVQAVLRRTAGRNAGSGRLTLDAIEIDLEAHAVRRLGPDGEAGVIPVTLTEFRILAHMARQPRRVFTRADLLDACLPGEGDALERTVDSHVSKLRKKLEQAGETGYLEGVRGVGYRLGRL